MLLARSGAQRVRAASSKASARDKKLPFERETARRASSTSTTGRPGKVFRRCHPRDVLTHALNLIHFEKLPYELTAEVLDRAFESCFVQEEEDAAPAECRNRAHAVEALRRLLGGAHAETPPASAAWPSSPPSATARAADIEDAEALREYDRRRALAHARHAAHARLPRVAGHESGAAKPRPGALSLDSGGPRRVPQLRPPGADRHPDAGRVEAGGAAAVQQRSDHGAAGFDAAAQRRNAGSGTAGRTA